MLDPRVDIPLQTVPDFCQRGEAPRLLADSQRFLSRYKAASSSPFSWRYPRQSQGSWSYHGEFLTRVNARPDFSTCTNACYSYHHFANTAPSTYQRLNFVRESLENPQALVHTEHRMGPKLWNNFAFHQGVVDKHFTFRSTLHPAKNLLWSDCYGARQGVESRRNAMHDMEASSIIRSFHEARKNVLKKGLRDATELDICKDTNELPSHHEDSSKWRMFDKGLARDQGSQLYQEKNWMSIGNGTEYLHGMCDRTSAEAHCFHRVGGEGLNTHSSLITSTSCEGITTTSVSPSAAIKVCTSPKQDTLTQQENTLGTVSGFKEENRKSTLRKDLCLRKLKNGFRRLRRPKLLRGGANTIDRCYPSRNSAAPTTIKNLNVKSAQAQKGDSKELAEEANSDLRKMFRCSQCHYVTDRKNNLKRHVITMHHKTTRVLECCGTIFHSKASLRDHVTLYHRGGYRCQVCGRNFCRKALLRRHLTVHSGQKDFACHLCGYATSHKSNLERHQRVHARRSSLFSQDFQFHSPVKESDMSPAAMLTERTPLENNMDNINNSSNRHIRNLLYNSQIQDHNVSSDETDTINRRYKSPSPYPENMFHRPQRQVARQPEQGDSDIKNDDDFGDMMNVEMRSKKTETWDDYITEEDDENSSSLMPTTSDSKYALVEKSHCGSHNNSLYSAHDKNPIDNQCKELTVCDRDGPCIETGICLSRVAGYPNDTDDSGTASAINSRNERELHARRKLQPKKGRFPNRLKETHPSDGTNTRRAAQNVCLNDQTSFHDRTESSQNDHEEATENVKENENPSGNFYLTDTSSLSEHEQAKATDLELNSCHRYSRRRERSSLHGKLRMYSLPYRCYGCGVCFACQGELRDHVCKVGLAGDVLDFPLMSSLLKGINMSASKGQTSD